MSVCMRSACRARGSCDGHVVAGVGEAGVGECRLVYECVHARKLQGWRVLESAAVSCGKAMPDFRIIGLLRRYTYVEERDDVQTIRDKGTAQVLPLDDT